MTDHIVKESTGDMRVTGMLTGNDPGAALRGDNLERLKARDEYLSQWAAAEIERLRKAHERYETARRMNPRQWAAAWELNLKTGKPFDEIIDDMRPFMVPNA